MAAASGYRFSFGPWNISEGEDPFGPPVRATVAFADKLAIYKQLGFDGMMLHDDDVVPEIEGKSAGQIQREAEALGRTLQSEGLVAEMVAPRLWEDPRGIDGPLTSNDAKARQWGIDRARRCADLCRAVGTDLLVLWLAREGTYVRESKQAMDAYRRLIDAVDAILGHDASIRVAIEPKPNEPVDHAYLPTIGHALALGHQTADPARVGGVIETAHSLLVGLDPSDDMAFALAQDKLWSVHLNDQNGLKFDQDKAFAAMNLRTAFNQVRVLEAGGYADKGMVAFDTKALRTSRSEQQTRHLANSRRLFLALVEKVRTWDAGLEQRLVAERDYEALELAILEHLMGLPHS